MLTIESGKNNNAVENLQVMPGMENIHEQILRPFGRQTATLIERTLEENGQITIACFLNGAIIPVAQTIAQLRRDAFEERISWEMCAEACNSITLFERIREKNPITEIKTTIATIAHPDLPEDSSIALNIDDIAETLETTDDLSETLPNADIIIAAAVKKHRTDTFLKKRGYSAHFTGVIGDNWILSGCGMDGSISFDERVSPEKLAELTVFQRCSNVGMYKLDEGKKSPNFQQQFDFFWDPTNILPWVTRLSSYDPAGGDSLLRDLVALEQAKMNKDYAVQMDIGKQIIAKFSQLDYRDVVQMTT